MNEKKLRYYMGGACPHFALAAHSLTGYPLEMLIDEADVDVWGDEEIPLIAHVYVRLPGDRGLDAKGVRSIAEIKEDFFDLKEPLTVAVTMSELFSYMGDERPLCAYDGAEVRKAQRVLLRLLDK